MALEKLAKYAEERNGLIKREADNLIETTAVDTSISASNSKSKIRTLVDHESLKNELNGRLAAIYQKQAENIRKSEALRSQINKGIKEGLPDNELLSMALECIGLMTGDTTMCGSKIKTQAKPN